MSDLKFLQAIAPERRLTIALETAACTRLRAYMVRVERQEPGLAFEPGESYEESLASAVGALLDRGLHESEQDDGLVWVWSENRLEPVLGTAHFGLRLRHAWRMLRSGQ